MLNREGGGAGLQAIGRTWTLVVNWTLTLFVVSPQPHRLQLQDSVFASFKVLRAPELWGNSTRLDLVRVGCDAACLCLLLRLSGVPNLPARGSSTAHRPEVATEKFFSYKIFPRGKGAPRAALRPGS